MTIFRDDKRELLMFLFGIGYKIWFLRIYKEKRVTAFVIDETVIQIGNQHFWLWICIEPINSSVLGIYISEENMFCGREFYQISCIQIWKTYWLYRWWCPGIIKHVM
ncbi:MAG: hypothetical protein MRJ93_04855 [Nitrososphaeraceae archaeon]|nr:hypothetical protein [Nitrososphaeraceae archaeon]